MKHILENERFQITVSDHGAELTGIYDKEKQHQILWQADPAFWNRQAPVLFPNVGHHYNNTYRIDGREYSSGQHGFARDMDFILSEETDHSLTHTLVSSLETLEKYPFDFSLAITHTLENNRLKITWQVKNTGDKTMYFSIGGHPAFNIPAAKGEKQTDYRLYFPGKASVEYKLIDTRFGTLIPDITYPLVLDDDHSCAIAEDMFDRDALVFDEQFEKVGFLSPDGTPYIEMEAEGFPNFGIWAAKGAPFICLEPWMGRCDDCGFTGDLSQKPYINALTPDETFCKSYTITIF